MILKKYKKHISKSSRNLGLRGKPSEEMGMRKTLSESAKDAALTGFAACWQALYELPKVGRRGEKETSQEVPVCYWSLKPELSV